MPAPRLFVSHSHLDSDFAKRLVADLQERLGEEAVWMDESGGLHGGDEWWRKIVAEITDREVFLVVLSPRALASEWVLKEMGIAYFQYVKAGKKLRPILLETCSLTTDWELIQAVNFTGGSDAYAAKLEELLGTLDLESATKPTPRPAAKRPPAVARLVTEVQTAFGLQDWRAVEDKTDALALIAPDAMSAALWQERGLALLALDNPALALEALDHALSIEPHDIPTLQCKGTALLALNRVEEAAAAFRLAYSLTPYDDIPLRLRALADLVNALSRAEKWAEAARRSEEGARLAPDDPDWQQRLQAARLGPFEAHFQAGYKAAMQAQRWDQALAACAEALNLAPDDAAWQQRQAQAEAARAEAARHAEAERQVLAEAALVAKYDAAMQAQRWDEALDAWEEARRLAPNDAGWLHRLEQIDITRELQRRAQIEAAQAQAERAAARERLTDGSYLEEKIRQQGVQAVLDELAQAEQDETLRKLAFAIRVGTDVLGKAPEEVWNQALGRAGIALRASRARQTPRFDLRFLTLAPANWASLRTLISSNQYVLGCAFSPDGKIALSASNDKTLRLWDVASGQSLHTLSGHTGAVRGCAFSPDGTLALSASEDKTLGLWDVVSGQVVRLLRGHTKAVYSCAFSPDSTLALSASDDGTLRLWNVASGQTLRTLKGHSSLVYSCAFSPDGRLALSTSDDGTIFDGGTLRLWDVTTGKSIRTLKGHTRSVSSCIFSPDGTLALSASDDRTLRLWNVVSGQSVRTLTGHTDAVRGCAFSPDSTLALSASEDKTLGLWNVPTGRELCCWTTDADLLCCAFAPDGKTVMAGDNRGVVHFLSLVLR